MQTIDKKMNWLNRVSFWINVKFKCKNCICWIYIWSDEMKKTMKSNWNVLCRWFIRSNKVLCNILDDWTSERVWITKRIKWYQFCQSFGQWSQIYFALAKYQQNDPIFIDKMAHSHSKILLNHVHIKCINQLHPRFVAH